MNIHSVPGVQVVGSCGRKIAMWEEKIKRRRLEREGHDGGEYNRYITDWNSIPTNIMHASSLSSFKFYLLDHLCYLNQE